MTEARYGRCPFDDTPLRGDYTCPCGYEALDQESPPPKTEWSERTQLIVAGIFCLVAAFAMPWIADEDSGNLAIVCATIVAAGGGALLGAAARMR